MPYYCLDGVIDTSGTSPQVGKCQDAVAQLQAAAVALAQGLLPGEPPEAVRPIIDMGDVKIAREDQMIPSPTGSGVITFYRLGDLELDSGGSYRDPYSPYVGPGGELLIDATPGQVIVVNVTGRFKMGRGSSPDSVNLPGTVRH